MSQPINVLVVDDHPMMCAGLRMTLASVSDIKVVAQAHNGSDAIRLFQLERPDVVTMDIDLGDEDGVKVAEDLLQLKPGLGVLIFSGVDFTEVLDRAVASGIRGFLMKSQAEQELVQAIRVVASGQSYMCGEVTTLMAKAYRRMLQPPAFSPPPLTVRELEVLKLTAQGLRVKEIAMRLNLGIKTVDTYRSQLLAKLNCSNASDLTRYAIRAGIISP